MDQVVITIARQYGSGGRTVGKMLAERLGISFYDKQIIQMASDESGIDVKLFGKVEAGDKVKSSLFGSKDSIYKGGLHQPGSKDFISDENLFNYQAKVVNDLAEKESCVIVGRCADFILQDRTDCLKVFVHADMKFRADRIVRVYGEREKSPEARLKEKDKRRAAYYRFYTDMKWGDVANYHIALDSGVIGIEKSAEIIESLA